MNTVNRIARNSIILLGSNIISKTFTFLYIIFMARYLGKTDFGVFSFAFAFCGLFVLLTDLGLDKLTVREVSRDKQAAGKYIGNFVLIKIFLGLITFGLIALIINILGYSSPTLGVVYLLGLHIVIRSFSNIFYAVVQANERMEYVSIGSIFGNALLFMGVLFAVNQKLDVTAFSFIFVIISAVDLGYAIWICLNKFAAPKLEFDWSFWKESIKTAWPLGAMLIFVMFYFRTDTIMINLMVGDPDVGLYSAAYRITEVPSLLPGLLLLAVFPVLSSFYKSSPSSFGRTYASLLKYMFYIAIPMAVVLTLTARPLVMLFYDIEYLGSVKAVQVLIWATAIMFMTMVQGSTFVAANKQRVSMKICAATVVLNIVLNFILIPKYSYVGASIATVFTEIFGFVMGTYFLSRFGWKINLFKTVVIPLFVLLIGLAVIFPLSRLGWDPFILACLFLSVYAPVIFLIGLKKEERLHLKSILDIKALFNSFESQKAEGKCENVQTN